MAVTIILGLKMNRLQYFSWITIIIFGAHYCVCENDDITQRACGESQPAEVTSQGTLIMSPMYPNQTYMLSQECTWLIRGSRGQIVQLTFTIFDLEDIYPCFYASVHVYDGPEKNDDEAIRKFCGRTLPEVTHTSTHEMFIDYKTMDQGLGAGFEATVEFIDINSIACSDSRPATLAWMQGGFVSPDWPSHYTTNVQCSWIIHSVLDLRLEFVEWNVRPPDEAGCADTVTLYDGQTITDPLIAEYCGPDLPDVTSMTSENILVVFKALDFYFPHDGKFRAKFSSLNVTEVGCGEDKNVDIDWGPGFIIGPLTNESNCRWRFYAPEGKVIRFEVEYFDLPSCANCGCAKVSLYDGEQFEDESLIGTYCEAGWTDGFLQSGGNTAGMSYESYRLSPGTGFSIKYTFFDFSEHACSSHRPINLTHGYGIITTPLYDKGYYPDNRRCDWSVQTTLGMVVELHFLTFDVQPCISCTCDVLLVYNGPSPDPDLEVRRLCDSYKPSLFMTSLPGAYLQFVSDDSITHSGFKIEYEILVLADKACGEQQPVMITMTPGDILSPNFGQGDYPQEIRCQWLISTEYEKSIELIFMTFDLEFDEPHRCQFDWVNVYDGDGTSAALLGRFCGNQLPGPLVSSGKSMLIEFESNHYIEGEGFHLEYRETNPLAPTNMALIIAPAVVCGTAAIAAILALMVIYCKKWQKKKQERRSRAPQSTPLTLGQALQSMPPSDRRQRMLSDLPTPSVSQVDYPTDDMDATTILPRNVRDSGGSDNFALMLSPPSYQESHNHRLTNGQHTSSMDCPPPTYEESLKHRLARYDNQLRISETSFGQNTVSIHHSIDLDETRTDGDVIPPADNTLNEIRAAILDMSRHNQTVTSAFEEEQESDLADLNVSRISRRMRLGSRSRSHDPYLDQSRESRMSRARAPTADSSILNITRRSMQPYSAAQVNSSFAVESQPSSQADESNTLVRRRALRGALDKQRLSKSYDDILNSKAFNVSMTNLDLVNKEGDVNTPGSSHIYNDPDSGTLRRRAKSETHLLTRLSAKDSYGTSSDGLSLLRQNESDHRETFI